MPTLPIAPHLAELVVQHSRVAIALTDAQLHLTFVNPAFTRITGYTPQRVIGRHLRVLRAGLAEDGFEEELVQALQESGMWEGELTARRQDGARLTEWLSVVAIRDERGDASHFVLMFNDISERKRVEERQAHLAMYDVLTELPNRFLFDEQLRKAIQGARRREGTLAVLFLDLDGFKSINDDFGHAEGDEVLRIVGGRVRSAVRSSDLVARRSGDEFTVCLFDPSGPLDILRCAAKVRRAVRRPLVTPEGSRSLDVSVGIARFPHDGHTDQELLQLADARMYVRKRHLAHRRRRLAGEPEPLRTPSGGHEAIPEAHRPRTPSALPLVAAAVDSAGNGL